jgi:methyl-accepting chemotaxis protein
MAEIHSMVETTLVETKCSNEATESMAETVARGQIIVEDLAGAMNAIHVGNNQLAEITQMVEKISVKTSVINDIVFKTQLLSVNASIEAARAGSHGAGFAIVAEEVGRLAESSGSAAKEIRDLIKESSSSVNSILDATAGRAKAALDISQRVKAIFNEISGQIITTRDKVRAITEASIEQEKGINKTSLALNEIDKATHASTRSTLIISGLSKSLETASND